MQMRRFIVITILFTITPLIILAQELEVQSFELSPMEIIASKDQRKDFNGDACALIKVQVVDNIDRVEGNIIGNIVSRGVEKWVYLTNGTKMFRLYFLQYLPVTISCSDFHIDELESKKVYILRLTENRKVKELSQIKKPKPESVEELFQMEEKTTIPLPKEENPNIEVHNVESESVLTFTVGLATFNMIRIGGGTFIMGGTSEQGSDAMSDEMPTHSVTINSFCIGETEVTQMLWEIVMKSNPSFNNALNKPVEKVSWRDCKIFIDSLNVRLADQLPEGRKFRLPTEAEWEFAARGGSKTNGYKYAGSDDVNEVAWYYDNSSRTTHFVKSKKPNELGLYDMSGNVCEWCEDIYSEYNSKQQINLTGPETEDITASRVYRGGGWSRRADESRISARSSDTPNSKYRILGFRLAL